MQTIKELKTLLPSANVQKLFQEYINAVILDFYTVISQRNSTINTLEFIQWCHGIGKIAGLNPFFSEELFDFLNTLPITETEAEDCLSAFCGKVVLVDQAILEELNQEFDPEDDEDGAKDNEDYYFTEANPIDQWTDILFWILVKHFANLPSDAVSLLINN